MDKYFNNKKKSIPGIILCTSIGIVAYKLGKFLPIAGGPVIGILLGMVIHYLLKGDKCKEGIGFCSKKVLHWAVILLGFGLNLGVILQTGAQSLPIIISTISVSLILAFLLQKMLKAKLDTAILVGVGSSICGGSAIAATAPVIQAKDEDVAQAISIIFFFNLMAAITFPALGNFLGFSTDSGDAFGIFVGTAVNDTSSVTACASTWDTMWNLGSATLDKAVTVKLTRTLAIIPITMILGIYRSRKLKDNNKEKINIKKILPSFILYFILASIITTVATNIGVNPSYFHFFKDISKLFIIIAMSAIGLNTDIIKLIKTGGKPLLIGFICWLGITLTSLFLQKFLGIW